MRSLPRLLFVGLLPVLGACGDDMPTAVDAHYVCDCPTPTAAEVSYDPTASGLAGGDVQDALDELAARPQPGADVLTRIELVEATETTEMAGTEHFLRVDCPADAKVLGGSCHDLGGVLGEVSLRQAHFNGEGFQCLWNKPEGEALEVIARATCLTEAATE